MDVAPIGYRRSDPVGTAVRWHAARHLGADGRVPLLDFEQCRLYASGLCVEMRDGKMGGLTFCGGNTFSF
jgi:hypothetical protein